MVTISQLNEHAGRKVSLGGWVYNIRSSKNLIFIELRDGTGICQCITSGDDVSESVWKAAESLTQESSLEITGSVVEDDRSELGYELHVSDLKIFQLSRDYPVTPKEHGVEFLMENRHLWLRSRRQWAIMRVRNSIVMAVHSFFQEREFLQLDSPIFTANAAEGTTTLFETDYFDDKAYLAQSGQLYAEAMAMAHGRVYTFGPTFRAEKSKTRRHLTEFWMIEPEVAFCDLEMNMDLAEDLIRFIISRVLDRCSSELAILERDTAALAKSSGKSFIRLSYDEAVTILKSEKTATLLENMEVDRRNEKESLAAELKNLEKEYGSAKKWRKSQIDQLKKENLLSLNQVEEDLRNIPVWRESASNFKWGSDFGGSDETLLMMQYDSPVIIHRYPSEVKAFYMKRDPENDSLALAMDLLAPEGYGEIIGGSQREDDYDMLKKRIIEHNLPVDAFKWYLDLRRYGSVPHSGFGLGLERTVAWICGLGHVRETIPFPRMFSRLTP